MKTLLRPTEWKRSLGSPRRRVRRHPDLRLRPVPEAYEQRVLLSNMPVPFLASDFDTAYNDTVFTNQHSPSNTAVSPDLMVTADLPTNNGVEDMSGHIITAPTEVFMTFHNNGPDTVTIQVAAYSYSAYNTPGVPSSGVRIDSETLENPSVASGTFGPGQSLTLTMPYMGCTQYDAFVKSFTDTSNHTTTYPGPPAAFTPSDSTPTGASEPFGTGFNTAGIHYDGTNASAANNILGTLASWAQTICQPMINTSQQPASATVGDAIADKATVTGGMNPTGTVTFKLYDNPNGTGAPLFADANEQLVGGVATSTGYIASATGTDYWVATYNGDNVNVPVSSGTADEPVTITGTPKLVVTKTADSTTITAGQTAGYTVTITNTGTATDTGVTLSDPLPAGAGGDINWTIDTTTGNPGDFLVTGAIGSQSLVLSPAFIAAGDSLPAGQSIAVHITSPTNAGDGVGTGGAAASNPSNFNGTGIAFNPVSGQNNYIWFNSVLNVSGLSQTKPTTVYVTNQTIAFSYVDPVTHATVNENLPVPNTQITFTPNLTQATLTFNTATNTWIENLPSSGLSGNVFAGGLAFKVPADGLPGGINPVTWNGSFASGTSGLGVKWQWAAAVYNNFTSTYNNLEVKPVDSNNLAYSDNGVSGPKNSDHAGTPENYTIPGILPGGARGGGGSNWTGSYSGTISVTPTPGTATLPNTATVSATNVTQSASATINVTSAPQLATGSGSQAAVGLSELLDPPGSLQTGPISFAVNLPQGPQAPAVQAAIASAVATLNAEVTSLGLSLVQVSGADAGSAQVHISFADTSAIGGLNQGIMGAYTVGQITLVNGWNWYLGTDPKGISPGQYDFQTVFSHELGHVLGLGENSDPSSVMSLYLNPGQVRRDLTSNDLSAIQEELGSGAPSLPASFVAAASGDLVTMANASPSSIATSAINPGTPALAGTPAADPEGAVAPAGSTTPGSGSLVVAGAESLANLQEGPVVLPAGAATAGSDTTLQSAAASPASILAAAGVPAVPILAGPTAVAQTYGATAGSTVVAPGLTVVPGGGIVASTRVAHDLFALALSETEEEGAEVCSIAPGSLPLNQGGAVAGTGLDEIALGDHVATAVRLVAPLPPSSPRAMTEPAPDLVDAVLLEDPRNLQGTPDEADERADKQEPNTAATIMGILALTWQWRHRLGRPGDDRSNDRSRRRSDLERRLPGRRLGSSEPGDRQ
jgi:uncharacterized repeat protein (TIGR01451 family)